MRKFHLTILAFLIVGYVFGQQYQTKQDAIRGIAKTTKHKTEKPQNALKNTNVVYFSEDFETDLSQWTTVDNDGDTHNWGYSSTLNEHTGTGLAFSASWNTVTHTALHPDNWLISNSIDLTSATGTLFLEWFIAAQDQTWPAEKYRVLVSTTGTAIGDFTQVYPDETVQAGGPDGNDYWKRSIDLSSYAGQTIHIAFQHHNCTDMFYIDLDDISIYQNTITDAGLTAIVAPNNDGGCSLSGNESVTATVFNYGGAAITDFDISYNVNGGTPVVEHVTGVNIAPATSYNYTFTQTANLSTLGYYVINSTINLTGDSDGSNNTASTNVTNGDGLITVSVSTDNQSGQSWEILNANGDVIATHGDYQWDITEETDVCVIANDCYTFNWSGGTSNTVTVSYNGTVVDNTTATGAYSVYAIGGNCSAIDAKLFSLNFDGYVMPSTNVDITGTVKNVGTDPITSFDVDYTINGGASVGTYSLTGLNILTGQNYNFTHNVQFNQSVEAIYTIGVTISNVNNATDGNTLDNVLSQNINVTSSQIDRTVVIEQFTTEECSNCPPVLDYLEGLYTNDNHTLILTHHSGYYTDFLTTQEHVDMAEFFNDGGSTYAPAGMFDRAYDSGDHDGDGTADPGPVFWDGDPYAANRIAEREAEPAFVSVNIGGTYNSSTHVLNVTVYGDFLDNFTNIGVSFWISEDHIAQQSQAAAPSGFEHRFTARDAISALLGDPIVTTTNAGSSYSKTYTYTVNSSWNYSNLYLVAFVNKINASNVNDREIANAKQVKLSDLQPLSVNGVSVNTNVNIYPNPTNNSINIIGVEGGLIEVLNYLGQVVAVVENATNFQSINLSENNAGTYIVRIKTNDNIIVKKVNLVK